MELRRSFAFFLSAFLAISIVSATAQSPSDDEFMLGVQSYKHSNFEEAIQHFEKSVELNSSNTRARLYLATAYTQQYIPGADTPDNNELGAKAVEQYRRVIELGAEKDGMLNAVKGIAYLSLQMKRFEEARDYYRKAAELDKDDPEPYYSIGVIDWTLTYQPRQEERAKLGLKPEESLPARNPATCAMMRGKNWVIIQDGIDNFSKALQLRPDYDDAMAYMNLMYRERADVQCDDPAAGEDDLKAADDWVDKTMAVKKSKQEKAEAFRKLKH